MNTAKNAALYVDFKDGKFVAPSERITPEMAAETASLNEEFLRTSFRNVELLRKLQGVPEQYSEWAVRFDKIAKELKAKYPDDPRTATKLLLEEIRSEAEKWMGAAKRLHQTSDHIA